MKGKIRVYCRLRPLSDKEIADHERNIVSCADEFTVEHPWKDDKAKQHIYDHVFDPSANQEDVFEDTKACLANLYFISCSLLLVLIKMKIMNYYVAYALYSIWFNLP